MRYVDLKPVWAVARMVLFVPLDTLTGKRVAIKKVTNTFVDLIDAKRIMREIKLLHQLEVMRISLSVRCYDVPTAESDFNDVHIVCDLMECDLDRIVSSDQAPVRLPRAVFRLPSTERAQIHSFCQCLAS